MPTYPPNRDVRIELIQDEQDLRENFACQYETFGQQTSNAFWLAMSPNADTDAGFEAGVKSGQNNFKKQSAHNGGHSWYLKAIAPDPETGKDTIAGIATWTENLHSRNPIPKEMNKERLEKLYPGNETEQRYVNQMFQSFLRRRGELVEEAGKEGRAVMVLDICVVRPRFQRRGIASELVKWGLRKAEELGQNGQAIECVTEASPMGKPVYVKLGFEAEGEVVYKVDEEFQNRKRSVDTVLRRPVGTKLVE
ncbi:GCN5-related N-acetyltransferase [Meira miltonrushii]|uniref:GCN5-related N-acetyltransferase n=1 Tax=Meira miltonrushii TaxID=1280837 RepID=A0A316VL76_9BASI|nr:GCN5-related N-acetyltransferase [Meira miltonrushii]PWN38306.1 GCN5-related N-acetyltransferase [Meira miltonrushii]